MTKLFLFRTVCVAGLIAAPALAGDKSGYHLFNPVPPELMRDLSTDRPDQTESPFTVDAGHFQLELDAVNYTYDRENGVTSETLAIAPVNFKLGLLNNVDLQLVLDTWLHQRVDGPDPAQNASGIGDFQTRLKVNLWGNDGGKTALGVMPFVKWPTATDDLGNGAVEGGVIIPLAIELTERAGLGIMTEFDFLRNEANHDYHVAFVNSVTFGYGLTDQLSAYVEFFTVVSTENNSDWQGQFDVGVTYGLTENIQLDTGVNIGVTRSAPDWQPFAGASFRF